MLEVEQVGQTPQQSTQLRWVRVGAVGVLAHYDFEVFVHLLVVAFLKGLVLEAEVVLQSSLVELNLLIDLALTLEQVMQGFDLVFEVQQRETAFRTVLQLVDDQRVAVDDLLVLLPHRELYFLDLELT